MANTPTPHIGCNPGDFARVEQRVLPYLRRQALREKLAHAAVRVAALNVPDFHVQNRVFAQAQQQFWHAHGAAVRVDRTLRQSVAVFQRPEQVAPFQRGFEHPRVVQVKGVEVITGIPHSYLLTSGTKANSTIATPRTAGTKCPQRKQSAHRKNKGDRAHSCRARSPSPVRGSTASQRAGLGTVSSCSLAPALPA